MDNLDSSKRGQVRVSTASTKNLPTSTAVLMSNWEEGTFLARVGSFSGWRRQSSYPGGEKTYILRSDNVTTDLDNLQQM